MGLEVGIIRWMVENSREKLSTGEEGRRAGEEEEKGRRRGREEEEE